MKSLFKAICVVYTMVALTCVINQPESKASKIRVSRAKQVQMAFDSKTTGYKLSSN